MSATEAAGLVGTRNVALIDLRERSERDKHGQIPSSLHVPYSELQESIGAGGELHELAAATGKRLLFYCAFGERSAMAMQAAQDAGLRTASVTARAALVYPLDDRTKGSRAEMDTEPAVTAPVADDLAGAIGDTPPWDGHPRAR